LCEFAKLPRRQNERIRAREDAEKAALTIFDILNVVRYSRCTMGDEITAQQSFALPDGAAPRPYQEMRMVFRTIGFNWRAGRIFSG